MAGRTTGGANAGGKKHPIETYDHKDKQRANNPPVGLVTPETDPDGGSRKTYAYDPHLDPQLQWAGKAEYTSFDIPTVSLHVHERIDPRSIIEAVRKRGGSGEMVQDSLFDMPTENPPLREAVEFYKHAHGWSNRMVAGDSLLVMNSLLEKEGMAGKVQMVYLDPPYGIKYGSNFQPFVNKRDVKDGKDEDLTAEPEQIRAFRDTWELGIHSYLTYLRDRLVVSRELLSETGSIFVQIGDENVHLVRAVMDEVFGSENFASLITFKKTSGAGSPSGTTDVLAAVNNYLLWYSKKLDDVKYRRVFRTKELGGLGGGQYTWIELPNGERRRAVGDEALEPAEGTRVFRPDQLTSQSAGETTIFSVAIDGVEYVPGKGGWKTNSDGMARLTAADRLLPIGKTLTFIRYFEDFPAFPFNNLWEDTVTSGFADPKTYVVQTNAKVIMRCMLMTTDPGDLVFDPTCGSGTTAFVAEQWGRRWITCDTSRVALALAKQRLMTAVFDYYQLAHPQEGVGSGFNYKSVPHITLKSIANDEPPAPETLYDQPFVDRKKHRVSGPFTVEAVPAPAVKSLDEAMAGGMTAEPADASIARSGETLRQTEWRDELQRTGIRGKAGQHVRFARLEPLPACRHLHADGETEDDDPKRIVVSFGPEHAPLEQRQVALAMEEAQTLVPRPKLIVFAAFQFDPEAAKDIDETNWPGVTLLKAQMNADMLTDDLKKKRASNESFWLIGQPDVRVERIDEGEDAGKWRVSVEGFDYYNTKTGNIESGGSDRIAVWLLDTDYDGRSLYPRQVFFPMAGARDGWARLARNLKAEIDEELIEAYRGTVSLPFEAGEHERIAVKIVDDRGIESLKIMRVE